MHTIFNNKDNEFTFFNARSLAKSTRKKKLHGRRNKYVGSEMKHKKYLVEWARVLDNGVQIDHLEIVVHVLGAQYGECVHFTIQDNRMWTWKVLFFRILLCLNWFWYNIN